MKAIFVLKTVPACMDADVKGGVFTRPTSTDDLLALLKKALPKSHIDCQLLHTKSKKKDKYY